MRRVIDVDIYRSDRAAKALADDLLARFGVPADDVVELRIGEHDVEVEQVVRPVVWDIDDDGGRRLRHLTQTFEL